MLNTRTGACQVGWSLYVLVTIIIISLFSLASVCDRFGFFSEPEQSVVTDFDLEKHLSFEFPTDKGHFPDKLTDPMKEFIMRHGLCRPQGPFPRNSSNRCFSVYFYGVHDNSNSWLCYSRETDSAYCQYCWLFSSEKQTFDTKDWQGLSKKVKEHELTQSHIRACITGNYWKKSDTVDKMLDSNLLQQRTFWRDVLRRLVEIILTISRNNIALRGSNDVIGSVSNGNFLSQVELLAKFDVTMNTLLSEKKKGSTTYLSPLIQNELISTLASRVRIEILSEVKAARFYSIIVDTTQDTSKKDQLSLTIRYVSVSESVSVKEAFMNFYHISDQTSEGLETAVLSILDENGIDIKFCRGQGYDGAANMSGYYNGLQKRIADVQPNALYVHCAAHNLNLVVNDAVQSITEVKMFFSVIQQIYVFFGHSIKRWDILANISSDSEVTLKSLNPTRWSARVNSLTAVNLRFSDLLQALTKIILTSSKRDTILEATSLKKKIENFEFLLTLIFLVEVFSLTNSASLLLQNKRTNLSKAVTTLTGVTQALKEYRNNFEVLMAKAKQQAEKLSISPCFIENRKSRNKFDDAMIEKDQLFRIVVFNGVIDLLTGQMDARFEGTRKITSMFDIFTPTTLLESSNSTMQSKVNDLCQLYPDDLTASLLIELQLLRSSMIKESLRELTTIEDLSTLLFVKFPELRSSFSNICTALRIFLTIPVTVASAERSFSKLKLIKNYVRTSISQERLQGLAVLSIEAERARNINFENVIEDFAERKSRRKLL